jgi:hypothetical protein
MAVFKHENHGGIQNALSSFSKAQSASIQARSLTIIQAPDHGGI